MKSLWSDKDGKKYKSDPLKMRVYTSRLLGQDEDLVLHGGGNTSVKAEIKNIFGQKEKIIYVKGSGWDLATIEDKGFAPVKMDVLLNMAQLKECDDLQMVKLQRAAMIDPYAPNPSVEAILHAIIPYDFVDHTHADSVVTITNTDKGLDRIKEIYGDKVLIIPYVMPGFALAKKVYDMTRSCNWAQYEGMILMNHGVFTFDDDAKKSYEKMIKLVSKAETYLKKKAPLVKSKIKPKRDLHALALIRKIISQQRGKPVLADWQNNVKNVNYSNHKNLTSFAQRGPLTPDHIIRTKQIPVILDGAYEDNIKQFTDRYKAYYLRLSTEDQVMLDTAPRWGVWPGYGTINFGRSVKENKILSDVTRHTIKAIEQAQCLGGWKALGEKDLFDVEYWTLEQAKLQKGGKDLPFTGRIALVTGAASGIGLACVKSLADQGACVVALDIDAKIKTIFSHQQILGLKCDVTNERQLKNAVDQTIEKFGGLDILISNAGIFPASDFIADIKSDAWSKSMNVNLSSHQKLLKVCIPYLSLGLEAAVVIVASKNVAAPGPGAGAYSVAKAGLTQLARVAALELGPYGIRVNVLHPNQVFDTGIWTKKVLKNRAEHYQLSVDEYKTNNILKVEITSDDVASLASLMVGPQFSKTTGAQIPIDGGNDRVI